MAATIEAIKELRDRTGVGMGKCKEALEASNGDMDEAIAYLRRKGVAGAVKKEGRATNEGLIGVCSGKGGIAFVEVNAETDFVVKNEVFQDFVKDLCQQAADQAQSAVDALLKQKDPKDPAITLDERRTDIMQKIGENIQVRRALIIAKKDGQSVGIYSHAGGKLCTAVVIDGANGQEDFARQIAMHVAAAAPEYLGPEDVPQAIRDSEAEIARAQMAGKPANVVDKILDGKMQAYYKQACLIKQPYIRDEKQDVEGVVAEQAKKVGKPLKITRFVSWKVGEAL